MQQESDKQIDCKPLVLSFWSPPIVRPQAFLLGKMLPEWIRQGVTPVLVHYDVCGTWEFEFPKYSIPTFSPSGVWKFPFLNFLAQWWYWEKISRIIVPLISKHNVNVIFSFANPMESNVIGAILARKTGVPYVAHFSDPWESAMRTHTKRGAWKIQQLEKFVVRHADQVTTVDDAMLAHISQKYPPQLQKKFTVINHCYDPREYQVEVTRPQDIADKFIISHVGSFYPQRTPAPLLSAIKLLVAERPDLRHRIVVKLVGGVSAYGGYSKAVLQECIDHYGLSDIVHALPSVTYAESLAEMKSADVLVVIDMEVSYFIAMKLIDYAGAGRPVVVIASRESSTAKIATKLGYCAFSYNEKEKLAEYLLGLITKHIEQRPNAAYRETFHVRETTKALFVVLDKARIRAGK